MAKYAAAPVQDLYFLLQNSVAAFQFSDLGGLLRRRAGTDPFIDVGDLELAVQTGLTDPEILRDLR